MPKLLASLSLGLVLCSASVSPAQAPYEEQQFQPPAAHRVIRPGGMTISEQLILERAVRRDRERSARLESRRWLGISLQRPRVQFGQHSTSLNGGLAFPWALPQR